MFETITQDLSGVPETFFRLLKPMRVFHYDFARLKISADSQVVRRCTESCVESPKCWAYKVFYTEIATPPRDRGECRHRKCQACN